MKRLDYNCGYNIYGSDHRPVYGIYEVDVVEGLSLMADDELGYSAQNCNLI